MKKSASRVSIALPYLLILGVGLLRLEVNRPLHLIPIFSCLLFFGARRPMREFFTPLFALVGIDIFLTLHRYGYPLSGDQSVTWLWYLATLLLGSGMLRGKTSAGRAIGASLLISISFFVASNFAVWADWNMYPKTLSGLGECYVAALPFFRNSIVAETLCCLLLFVGRDAVQPSATKHVHVTC